MRGCVSVSEPNFLSLTLKTLRKITSTIYLNCFSWFLSVVVFPKKSAAVKLHGVYTN